MSSNVSNEDDKKDIIDKILTWIKMFFKNIEMWIKGFLEQLKNTDIKKELQR